MFYGFLEVTLKDAFCQILDQYLHYHGPHLVGIFTPQSLHLHYALYNMPVAVNFQTLDQLKACAQVQKIEIYVFQSLPLTLYSTIQRNLPTMEILLTAYEQVKRTYYPQPLAQIFTRLLRKEEVFTGYDLINCTLCTALELPIQHVLTSSQLIIVPQHVAKQNIALTSNNENYQITIDRNISKIFFTVLEHEFTQTNYLTQHTNQYPHLHQAEEQLINYLLDSLQCGNISIDILNQHITNLNQIRKHTGAKILATCFNHVDQLEVKESAIPCSTVCTSETNLCVALQDLGTQLRTMLNILLQQQRLDLDGIMNAYNRCASQVGLEAVMFLPEFLDTSHTVRIALGVQGNIKQIDKQGKNLGELTTEELLDALLWIESRRSISDDSIHSFQALQNLITEELSGRSD
jgi:hypothetical protein